MSTPEQTTVGLYGKPGRAALLESYLSAFRAANPDAYDRVPRITYENGWWIFRYGDSDVIHSRYRTARLLHMRDALERRSNGT